MRISAPRRFHALFLIICFGIASSQEIRLVNAQDSPLAERLPPSVSESKETEYVSCWKKGEKEIKSRIVRSPILMSPGGVYSARVEVEAVAFKPKDEATYAGPLCFNNSTLFVEGPAGKKFKIVYSDSPKVLGGNSIKLIDWAPDAKSLLVEAAQWEYESEGIYTEFFIFSVDLGMIAEPDLREVLAARFEKDCWSENTVLGFTATGDVIVSVKPDADTIGLENGATSCVKRKTLVSLNPTKPAKANVQILPANTKIIQNGGFVPTDARR